MGSFISTDWRLRLDDRTLAHLEYVVVQQFRRDESFLLTWIDHPVDGRVDDDEGVERSLWLSPSLPVGFEFDALDTTPLELAWVAALSSGAGSTEGLRLDDADGRALRVFTEPR